MRQKLENIGCVVGMFFGLITIVSGNVVFAWITIGVMVFFFGLKMSGLLGASDESNIH